LNKRIGNEYSVAALMGSLYDDSIIDFDSLGFTQWRYKVGKKTIFSENLASSKISSALDYFCNTTEKQYKKFWTSMKSAKSIQEASSAILKQFALIKNQSISFQNKLVNYAKNFYEKYSKKPKNDKRMCKEFWDQYSKTNYPTREQYVEGMQKVIGPKINYTQGAQRWSGIKNKTCPPTPPTYTDCSGFTTWGFWTAFGGLDDIINGANWSAGYTGSMQSKGTKVSSTSDGCKPGDVILYPGHVALYIGNDKVLNYGSTGPAKILKYNYKGITGCFRYKLPFGEPL